ncbi:uncharacterized protein [Nicotiana sylvestris]|uniref:uncharacterized protein n=1 Tax=Nicotiana sylvestris TaxID=4096 RepID=UPI00388C3ED3
MKILSEAYVPSNITGGEIANIVGQVLESHKITFHEDELPPKGLGHNKTLHITTQCEDHFITRILVDGGSSLNICPLVTLRTLGKGLHEINDGTISVKAFNGYQSITITYLDDEPMTVTCNETMRQTDIDSEEDEIPEEVVRKIWMDEEDAEKMAFITPWGMYYYRMMSFSLENAGATYMRAMTTIFHDMIHKEIKVYVNDVIIKSRKVADHMGDLRKFFNRLRRMDPLKYIFQKPMPTGKLAKWQILLSEFDIVYVTQKAVKGQAVADHLAENPIGGEYEPLKMYFPDEEIAFIGEDIAESYDGWRMFFDGAANFKGVGIGAVLVSETGQHYLVSAKLRFPCTNNMAEYEACILGLKLEIDMNIQELLVIGDSDLLIHQVREEWAIKNSKILPYLHHVQELRKRFRKTEFQHVPRIQNEFADALATLSSMIQHPDTNFIDPIQVKIHDQPAYCSHVEEEADGKPWFHDIREYLTMGEYPELANATQKRALRRLSNNFFHSGGVLYRRTPDMGLLRCVEAREATKLLEKVHAGTCGPHMNGFVLAKKILRAGYFWMTMETDCIQFIKLFTTTFGGTYSKDPRDYLDKCHEVLRNMGIMGTNRVDFATFSLSGSAKTWWRDYCLARLAGSPALIWDQFSHLFLEKFLPIN